MNKNKLGCIIVSVNFLKEDDFLELLYKDFTPICIEHSQTTSGLKSVIMYGFSQFFGEEEYANTDFKNVPLYEVTVKCTAENNQETLHIDRCCSIKAGDIVIAGINREPELLTKEFLTDFYN